MIGHFCGLIKQFEKNVVQMWAAEQPFVGEERYVTRQKRPPGILRATLTQAISPWEAVGRTSSVTAPKVAL